MLQVKLAVLGLTLGALALVAQPQSKPTSFSEIGNYDLELGGKKAPARFFHSPGYGTILVDIPELGKRVVLDPRARSLNVYLQADFAANPDGTLDRAASARPVATERFELVNQLPVFSVDGRTARLLLKPHMLGRFDRAKLLAENPGYGARAAEYQPVALHIDRLKEIKDPIVVKIFFGSWCGVCFEMMPHIVRIEEELKGSSVSFEYYGLPAGLDDPEAKRQGVGSVPTGLVFRKGEEVGRLQGYSFNIPEMSLANLLGGVVVPDLGRPQGGR